MKTDLETKPKYFEAFFHPFQYHHVRRNKNNTVPLYFLCLIQA